MNDNEVRFSADRYADERPVFSVIDSSNQQELAQRITFSYSSSADGKPIATAKAMLQACHRIDGHFVWLNVREIPCHIEEGKVTVEWGYAGERREGNPQHC